MTDGGVGGRCRECLEDVEKRKETFLRAKSGRFTCFAEVLVSIRE